MRLQWVHLALDTSKTLYTPKEMHELILEFIKRNDAERQALLSEQRPNRPRAPRLLLIESQAEQDTKDYNTNGFMMPELTVAKHCAAFKYILHIDILFANAAIIEGCGTAAASPLLRSSWSATRRPSPSPPFTSTISRRRPRRRPRLRPRRVRCKESQVMILFG